jgi:lipid II:glycine glycyltransferase (peptidoglycan interpeptide bridge formation enzyme)
MKNKAFDAVALTRQIRDQMYEETKQLEPDELLRYFKERSREVVRRVQARGAETQERPSHSLA